MLNQPVGIPITILTYEQAKTNYPVFARFLMKPFNNHYIVAAVLFNDKEWFGGISLQRSLEQGEYTVDDLNFMSLLLSSFSTGAKDTARISKTPNRTTDSKLCTRQNYLGCHRH